MVRCAPCDYSEADLIAAKKLTRKQLMQALGDRQSLFGQIQSAASDKNPNRAAEIDGLCKVGFEFCVEVLSTEPPVQGSLIGKYEKGFM